MRSVYAIFIYVYTVKLIQLKSAKHTYVYTHIQT